MQRLMHNLVGPRGSWRPSPLRKMPVRNTQTDHLFHHQQTNVQFAHPCSFRLQTFSFVWTATLVCWRAPPIHKNTRGQSSPSFLILCRSSINPLTILDHVCEGRGVRTGGFPSKTPDCVAVLCEFVFCPGVHLPPTHFLRLWPFSVLSTTGSDRMYTDTSPSSIDPAQGCQWTSTKTNRWTRQVSLGLWRIEPPSCLRIDSKTVSFKSFEFLSSSLSCTLFRMNRYISF